jgi:hypothetical protein
MAMMTDEIPEPVEWEKLNKILEFDGWDYVHRASLQKMLLQFQNLASTQKIIHARDLDDVLGNVLVIKPYVSCEAAGTSGILTDYNMKMRDGGVDLVIDGKIYNVGDTDVILIGEPAPIMHAGEEPEEGPQDQEETTLRHNHIAPVACTIKCPVYRHYYDQAGYE